MRTRAVIVLAAIAGIAGCNNDEAEVSLSVNSRAPVTPEVVQVSVSDGARTWTFTGEDFVRGDGRPTIATRTRGTLSVMALVRAPGEFPAYSRSFGLPLQPDWRWDIVLIPAATDPTATCLGCQGAAAIPLPESLRAEGRDSLYIVWGGNSISDPVVY
jgi:hypothetical protein